ncbi:MAG: DNA-binding protein [Candidatus Caldatribacterium sp.]|uniref:PPC domain-containing DNA-binding protein n=1 Tax=Candidatus Caldatribacterium sp. TaxID=2282143 RepID=UPI00299B0197|nr:DNA-binding protein [Candidatus Caldatribacterium sp.]MCX7730112.1 DNA-binding protein [Candidatus Caldatribacterium sp.]MDW8080431.1 DNA-binding protein [Candidatus Calescibacterium sp.]
MDYGCGKLERVVVVSIFPGECVLETIEEVIRRERIEHGVILSGFGTLKEVHLHWVTTTDFPPVEHFEKYEGPFELLSLSGVIVNGEPHIHAVVSNVRGAYGGHLRHGNKVLYLCEVAIGVLSDIAMWREQKPEGVKQLRFG